MNAQGQGTWRCLCGVERPWAVYTKSLAAGEYYSGAPHPQTAPQNPPASSFPGPSGQAFAHPQTARKNPAASSFLGPSGQALGHPQTAPKNPAASSFPGSSDLALVWATAAAGGQQSLAEDSDPWRSYQGLQLPITSRGRSGQGRNRRGHGDSVRGLKEKACRGAGDRVPSQAVEADGASMGGRRSESVSGL